MESDKTVTVEYTLPLLATGGVKKTLKFSAEKSPGKLMHFRSESGEMTCLETPTGQSCLVALQPFQLDQGAAHAFIESKEKDPLAVQQRLKVATAFSTEPIGTLDF